ncbi:hypothetical protein A2881_03395 [Candidatus Peribacteria bacterium RIFCSPHIGHO2_01_FULL_55_13]|nr:MAG: hypothetical protein A2881_03395 [Candidatus Peribacteria bacterium RIFCSPHIGHO2_01_FULL_55_13]
MPFSAILFDLDGTLIDSPKLWREAYRRVLKDIGHAFRDEDFALLYPSGKPMRDWLTELGIEQSHYAALRTKRDELYEEMLRNEIVWHDDAETCFKTVAKKYPTGIVTGSHKTYIDAIEHRIPLRSLVKVLLDETDLEGKSKPRPDGLLMAAQKLNVDPRECVYIGDQPFDAEAAKNAGMECWIVRRPFAPEKFHVKPQKRFDALEEALKFL